MKSLGSNVLTFNLVMQAKQGHIIGEGHMSAIAFRETYHFNEDTQRPSRYGRVNVWFPEIC